MTKFPVHAAIRALKRAQRGCTEGRAAAAAKACRLLLHTLPGDWRHQLSLITLLGQRRSWAAIVCEEVAASMLSARAMLNALAKAPSSNRLRDCVSAIRAGASGSCRKLAGRVRRCRDAGDIAIALGAVDVLLLPARGMSAQQLVNDTPRIVPALVKLMSRAAPLLRRGGGSGRRGAESGAMQLVVVLYRLHFRVLFMLRTAGAAATPAVRDAAVAALRSILECTHVAGYLSPSVTNFWDICQPVEWWLADVDPGGAAVCAGRDAVGHERRARSNGLDGRT